MRTTDRIRILRDITLFGVTAETTEPFTVSAGQVLNGPTTITSVGNALIGLAYDEPVVVPVGAFEVVE